MQKYTIGVFSCLFCLLAVPVQAAQKSPWSLGVEVFALADDNISRAEAEADIEEDVSANAVFNVSYTAKISTLSAVSITGALKAEEFQDFDGLSNSQAGVVFDYRFQTRLGFLAPTYSLFARFFEADFETDNRDGTISDVGFTSTKRLTTTMVGSAGVAFVRRNADGEVFDLEQTRLFGNLDLRLNNKWAVYTTYSYIDGDVFSTATPTVPIINWADAIEPDNAFGGIANNKFVYRLDAETQIIKFGFNYGVSRSSAIDVSVEQLDSDAAGPNEYDRFAVLASFLHRF